MGHLLIGAAMSIDAFNADPKEITLSNGSTVEVRELQPRNFGRFARAARSLMPYVTEMEKSRDSLTDTEMGQRLVTVVIAALADDKADTVIEAIAACLNKPAEEIGALGLTDLIALGGACVEVNADFFVRQVRPVFAATAAAVKQRLETLKTKAAGSDQLPG